MDNWWGYLHTWLPDKGPPRDKSVGKIYCVTSPLLNMPERLEKSR